MFQEFAANRAASDSLNGNLDDDDDVDDDDVDDVDDEDGGEILASQVEEVIETEPTLHRIVFTGENEAIII